MWTYAADPGVVDPDPFLEKKLDPDPTIKQNWILIWPSNNNSDPYPNEIHINFCLLRKKPNIYLRYMYLTSTLVLNFFCRNIQESTPILEQIVHIGKQLATVEDTSELLRLAVPHYYLFCIKIHFGVFCSKT